MTRRCCGQTSQSRQRGVTCVAVRTGRLGRGSVRRAGPKKSEARGDYHGLRHNPRASSHVQSEVQRQQEQPVYHHESDEQRFFVQSPYTPDAQGVLCCQLPTRCPQATADTPCRIGIHHHRERTTGPCFALVVARCHAHPKPAFTVYPPPHVPYGRVAMAPARLDGGGLLQEGDSGATAWKQTVFVAAQAAARGERWDTLGMQAEGMRNDPGHARTQGRHLELAGKLTGVHPELSEQQREAVAHNLDVPLLCLHEGSARWQSGSWTVRGEAIAEALRAIPVTRSLPDRLLDAGAQVGLWPVLHRWQPTRGVLVRSGTQAHPGSQNSDGPDPPSTTSQRQAPLGSCQSLGP